MLSEIPSAYPILFTIIWQTSLLAAAGLILSYLNKRHPARAHQVLFLSMIAVFAVPFMSIAVKHLDIGILKADLEPAAIYVAKGEVGVEAYMNPSQDFTPSVRVDPQKQGLPWSKILLAGWIAASVTFLARLMLSFILGIHLVNNAQPFKYQKIAESIKAATSKLGIKENIVVHCSKSVSSPVIWCWKQKPILLLPSDKKVLNDKIDLVGIFCHELAHVKRRDHVAGLLSELIVVFLPWHPLLWWAKKRLLALSENACDDWVIAAGGCGTNYAESLLDLLPARQMAFVPAVVRNKNLLKGRVMRMLKERYENPRLSKKWILSTILITTCITLTVAFAQPRSASSDVVDATPQQDISDEANNAVEAEQAIKEKTRAVIQGFFDAYNARDFMGMRKDFSERLIEIPTKDFEEHNKRDLSKYGEVVAWDYTGFMSDDEHDIDFVRVDVNYAKGGMTQYGFSFDKGQDGNKIQSLVQGEVHFATDAKQATSDQLPTEDGVFQMGEVDTPPRVVSAFPPEYPADAKINKIEGDVVVRFLVDTDGLAWEPEVVEADPEGVFEQSALDAIVKYEFEPATKDGMPVSCIIKMPVVFSLR